MTDASQARRAPRTLAVVGLACRFPDADDPAGLLDVVLTGRRSFRRIPAGRVDLAEYYHPDRAISDATYSTRAALIEDWRFDAAAFGVSADAYQAADPAHWLALETAARALAAAGLPAGTGLDRDRTGVIIGNTLAGEVSRANALRVRWPYVRRVLADALAAEDIPASRASTVLRRAESSYLAPFPAPGPHSLAGSMPATIASTISMYFGLRGVSQTVDSACSSSLQAVFSACAALAAGELDAAIAGGVDLSLDPLELIGLAKAGLLAVTDVRVYDQKPTGYLPGEGCGMLVLMRTPDARAAGLPVYAEILGWGASSGAMPGEIASQASSQLLAMRRAYERAAVDPADITFIEGNGSSTALADSAELSALGSLRAGATQTAALGSVKANIGHAKAAAGAASLIKTVLALGTGILPPTTGADRPHELIASGDAKLTLPDAPAEWPAGPRLAAVSAAGLAGSNVHLVLRHEPAGRARQDRWLRSVPLLARAVARGTDDGATRKLKAALPPMPFLLQAPDRYALGRLLARLAQVADGLSDGEFQDLACALGRDPEQHGHTRIAIVAARQEQLAALTREAMGMLPLLADGLLVVREDLFAAEATSGRVTLLLSGDPSASVHAVQSRTTDGNATSGPALTMAVNRCLDTLRWLDSLDVNVTAAVGHGVGALVGLAWAGVLGESEVIEIAKLRAQFLLRSGRSESHRAGTTAGQNTSRGGDSAALRAAIEQKFRLGPPRRRLISTMTGAELRSLGEAIDLICSGFAYSGRIDEAVAMGADGATLLLETGPGRMLTDAAVDVSKVPAISIHSAAGDPASAVRAAAALFAAGALARPQPLFAGLPARPIDIWRSPAFLGNPCQTRSRHVPRQRQPSGSEILAVLAAPTPDDDPLAADSALAAQTGRAAAGETAGATANRRTPAAAAAAAQTAGPGTADPGTPDRGTADPGTADPGTQDPGTQDPGTQDPGTADPGTAGLRTSAGRKGAAGTASPDTVAERPLAAPTAADETQPVNADDTQPMNWDTSKLAAASGTAQLRAVAGNAAAAGTQRGDGSADTLSRLRAEVERRLPSRALIAAVTSRPSTATAQRRASPPAALPAEPGAAALPAEPGAALPAEPGAVPLPAEPGAAPPPAEPGAASPPAAQATPPGAGKPAAPLPWPGSLSAPGRANSAPSQDHLQQSRPDPASQPVPASQPAGAGALSADVRNGHAEGAAVGPEAAGDVVAVPASRSAGVVEGLASWTRCFAEDLRPVRRPATTVVSRPWRVFAAARSATLTDLSDAVTADPTARRTLAIIEDPADGRSRAVAVQAAKDAIKTGELVVLSTSPGFAGFFASLHAEHPSISITMLRVPPAGISTAAVLAFAAAETGTFRELVLGPAGTASKPVPAEVELPGGGDFPLGSDDVVLITRGTRGAGLVLAKVLACCGNGVAVIGRAGAYDDSKLVAGLEELRAAGARVGYEVIDVGDAASVTAAVRRIQDRLGPVTAIAHGTGLDDYVPVSDIAEPETTARLGDEAALLDRLAASIPDGQLQLIISLGTVAGRYGLSGAGGHALASAALTSRAAQLAGARSGCRAVHVDLPAWSADGLGDRPELTAELAAGGTAPMDPAAASRLLLRLMTSPGLVTTPGATAPGEPATPPSSAPSATPAQQASFTVHGRIDSLSTVASTGITAAELAAAGLPYGGRFLREVVVHYPGLELVCSATLSLDSDPYLADYRADGLPVLPPTLALEALAEAASVLAGRPVRRATSVALEPPVLIPPGGEAVLRVYALRRGDTIVAALRCADSSYRVDHARAEFSCAAEPRELPQAATAASAALQQLVAASAGLVDGAELYGPVCFQTGRFRRVALLPEITARSGRALARGADDLPWFAADSDLAGTSLLLGSPGLGDAALQVLQACAPHRRVRVAGCESVHFSGRPAEGPVEIRAIARPAPSGGTGTSSGRSEAGGLDPVRLDPVRLDPARVDVASVDVASSGAGSSAAAHGHANAQRQATGTGQPSTGPMPPDEATDLDVAGRRTLTRMGRLTARRPRGDRVLAEESTHATSPGQSDGDYGEVSHRGTAAATMRAPVTSAERIAARAPGIANASLAAQRWDVEAVDTAGHLLASWRGIRLHDCGPLPHTTAWPPTLLSVYLERMAADLGLGDGVRVTVSCGQPYGVLPQLTDAVPHLADSLPRQAPSLADRAERRDRAPGKPAAPATSAAGHERSGPERRAMNSASAPGTGLLTGFGLSVRAAAPVACGWAALEPNHRQHEAAAALTVACTQLRTELAEPADVLAARLDAVTASLKMASQTTSDQLMVARTTSDGWALLVSGSVRVASAVVDLSGVPTPVAIALLTGGQAHSGSRTADSRPGTADRSADRAASQTAGLGADRTADRRAKAGRRAAASARVPARARDGAARLSPG